MKSALIIDDDQIFNFLNKRILTRLNLFDHVYECTSSEYALKTIEDLKNEGKHLPGLILVDVKLPRENGFEFLNKLAEEHPEFIKLNPLVAILTSSLDPKDRVAASQTKFNSVFIEKPLDKNKILEVMNQFP